MIFVMGELVFSLISVCYSCVFASKNVKLNVIYFFVFQGGKCGIVGGRTVKCGSQQNLGCPLNAQ